MARKFPTLALLATLFLLAPGNGVRAQDAPAPASAAAPDSPDEPKGKRDKPLRKDKGDKTGDPETPRNGDGPRPEGQKPDGPRPEGQRPDGPRKNPENLTPDQQKKRQENLDLWKKMTPAQRKEMREREQLRRQKMLDEIQAALAESGLQLEGEARDAFVLRYQEERRKIEEKLQREMEEKRKPMVQDLVNKLKTEFQDKSSKATPVPATTPAAQ